MRLLTDVDGDEIAVVSRAANRRKFLLLKGDEGMDNDLDNILETPWEREGALLDEIRKDGIMDQTVEKAVIAAVRLLKGVEDEFSPELIEKLGAELYPHANTKLNTSPGVDADGELFGDSDSDEGDPVEGDADGDDTDGSAAGGPMSGGGSAPKVAADDDANDLAKRDVSTAERKNLASQGKALPDKSFPIANKGDLGNAIKLAGRSKNPGKARAFIIRRAKALGATGMLPDSWNVSKEEIEKADISPDYGDDFIVDEERGTVETHVVPVQKEDGSWDFDGVPDETRSFYEAMIQKADKTAEELEKTKEKLAKADDTLLNRTMLEKAARLSHVAAADDLAPILKEASQSLSQENFEKLETLLTAAEERVQKGDLFSEKGKTGLGDSESQGDAYSKLVAKADEIIEKGADLTPEAAFDRAMRENPDLYSKYMYEHGMGV